MQFMGFNEIHNFFYSLVKRERFKILFVTTIFLCRRFYKCHSMNQR